MAVNSYSELGIDVQMDVFDSALDRSKIDQILDENNFEIYDFIAVSYTHLRAHET